MKFTIRTAVISGNELMRLHWAARAKMREDLRREIWAEARLFEVSKYAKKKIRKSVDIVSYRRRRLDKDDLYDIYYPIIIAGENDRESLALLYSDRPLPR